MAKKMARNTKQRKRILPQNVSEYLRHRLAELTGIALIIVAGTYFFALVSYDRTAVSLNTAGTPAGKNLLGAGGAYTADLMLQLFGITAILLVPILVAWGFRLIVDRILPKRWLRLLFVPVVLILFATILAVFGRVGWPVHAGLGGAVGEAIQTRLFSFLPAVLVSLILLPVAFILLLYTMAVSPREWSATGLRLATIGEYTWSFCRRLFKRKEKVQQSPTIKTQEYRRKQELRRKKESIVATSNTVQEQEKPKRLMTLARYKKDKNVEKDATKTRVMQRSKATQRSDKGRQAPLGLDDDSEGFMKPTVDLLDDHSDTPQPNQKVSPESLEQNARMLESVLKDFGVRGEIKKVSPGPVVTLYELEPAPGTKTSRVISLADDIARSMSALSVRISTIPGKSVIGIEMPNAQRDMVDLRELLESRVFENYKGKLALILGKNIAGSPEIADLATMPHLLVAGTTGSGKSVGANAMILSLLYRHTPKTCRFIMIDPKMLELSIYNDIPHLLTPVVTDPKKAVVALKWTVREMEDRYRKMAKFNVRNIDGYNKRVKEAQEKGEVITRKVQTGFDSETRQPIIEEEALDLSPLPFIVVVVDEMADLMLVAGKDIEASVQRLAQMARAAGIHVIVATQRPSVDVITGTIKANFPTRISFMVTSKIDSRTILGEQGAEQLLGKGDMLYMAGGSRITRVHGPFVSDKEVEKVCNFLKTQAPPDYIDSVTDDMEMNGGFETDVSGASGFLGGKESGDALYDQAVAIVARDKKASTSYIQRRLQIGYNRAARLIEKMEDEGVVGAANHVGKREILIHDQSSS